MHFRLFLAALVLTAASPAAAQTAPARAGAEEARPHFEQALSFYRAGKYHLAAGELHAALALDPGGKDLVFNLALVQEKLGDLPGAIASLERFQTMEKDPAELERAFQTIQRLRGAEAERRALWQKPSDSLAPQPCPEPPVRGKLDGWVTATGGVSVVALLVGTAFGVHALTLAGDGQGDEAQSAVVVADAAFAAALVSGGSAVALYFGRYRDLPQTATPPNAAFLPLPRISAAALSWVY